MATAYTYVASKRHNSTLQPTGGTSVDVQLKGGCDLNSPTFLMAHSGIPAYSMLQFNGKYYFVNRVRSVREGLFEVDCSIDVLATYKTNIQATSAFVKYYSHTNTDIVDNRLSTKTVPTLQVNSGMFTVLGAINGASGTIVLMVNGTDTVGAYAIVPADLPAIMQSVNVKFLDDIVNNIDFTPLQTAQDIIDWLTIFGRILGDWFISEVGQIHYSGTAIENIRTAHMLPLSLNNVSTEQAAHIWLGSFETNVDGRLVKDRIFTDAATVAIPWQASDWRRNSPYHELFLYIPYVGLTQLSPSDLIGETNLKVIASLDKLTGDCIFEVETGNGNKIGHYSSNIASDYPIGASNVTMAKGMSGVVTSAAGLGLAVGTVMTGGATAPLLAGASAAGVGLVNSITPTNTSIGGVSGAAAWGLSDRQYVKCISVFHDTVVAPSNPSAVFGTPFNAVTSLGGIAGYVQTVGASVEGNMGDDERQEINRLLDGGIYIE